MSFLIEGRLGGSLWNYGGDKLLNKLPICWIKCLLTSQVKGEQQNNQIPILKKKKKEKGKM